MSALSPGFWRWYYAILAAIAFGFAIGNASVHQWGHVAIDAGAGVFALVQLRRAA